LWRWYRGKGWFSCQWRAVEIKRWRLSQWFTRKQSWNDRFLMIHWMPVPWNSDKQQAIDQQVSPPVRLSIHKMDKFQQILTNLAFKEMQFHQNINIQINMIQSQSMLAKWVLTFSCGWRRWKSELWIYFGKFSSSSTWIWSEFWRTIFNIHPINVHHLWRFRSRNTEWVGKNFWWNITMKRLKDEKGWSLILNQFTSRKKSNLIFSWKNRFVSVTNQVQESRKSFQFDFICHRATFILIEKVNFPFSSSPFDSPTSETEISTWPYRTLQKSYDPRIISIDVSLFILASASDIPTAFEPRADLNEANINRKIDSSTQLIEQYSPESPRPKSLNEWRKAGNYVTLIDCNSRLTERDLEENRG
jgi:hypothetical protein